MTEGPRKPQPPPRFPRPNDPELVRVSEDEPPPTERVPLPRPLEPFRLLKGRGDSYVEIAAQLDGITTTVNGVSTGLAQVLVTQQRQARQLDGFGKIINDRFNLFHEELALLRATVVGDHEPRLGKVESTMGQKAAKGGGIAALVLIALPMLADALPKYRHIIDAVLGVLQ